jgi:dihydroorotase-like cyclic amidohydrolase
VVIADLSPDGARANLARVGWDAQRTQARSIEDAIQTGATHIGDDWQALVQQDHWPIEQLWQILCWGPCNLLGLAPEVLEPGGRRWLLFDPQARWSWPEAGNGSLAANQPLRPGTAVQGLVRATGLLPCTDWQLS